MILTRHCRVHEHADCRGQSAEDAGHEGKQRHRGGDRGPGVTRDFSLNGWPLYSAKPPYDILAEVTQAMPGTAGGNARSFRPLLSQTGRTVGEPGGPTAHRSVLSAMGSASHAPNTTVRWDLTVLRDPNRPPYQSNVSAWIEIKGDKELPTRNQAKASKKLKKLKGRKPRLITVTPSSCGCPESNSGGV